jgi:hypothetical protein
VFIDTEGGVLEQKHELYHAAIDPSRVGSDCQIAVLDAFRVCDLVKRETDIDPVFADGQIRIYRRQQFGFVFIAQYLRFDIHRKRGTAAAQVIELDGGHCRGVAERNISFHLVIIDVERIRVVDHILNAKPNRRFVEDGSYNRHLCIFFICIYSILPMNLLEQLIICILQQFTNPFFEPVIIDNTLLRIFDKFVLKLDLDKSNIALLRDTRDTLRKLPTNEFLSVVFRANLTKCIDVLILILQTNEDTIGRLTKENEELKKNQKITQIGIREFMTIPFTLIR